MLGDIVRADGDEGEIKLICLSNSEDAANYGCQEHGGILIKSTKHGLVLIGLENKDELELIKRPPEQKLDLSGTSKLDG